MSGVVARLAIRRTSRRSVHTLWVWHTSPTNYGKSSNPANVGAALLALGFSGDQIPPGQAEAADTIALKAGYRHIDTAAAYRDEAKTGAAIAASSLPCHELYVTTKVWNNDQGRDRTRRAFESSLSNLGLDYLDLYLIH